MVVRWFVKAGGTPGWSALVLALMLVVAAPSSIAEPVKTPHVTAELVAEQTAVRPGEPVRIGLKLQHIPHWHTYWRNPGDSGLPTTLEWTLPGGGTIGEIDWPAPRRLPIGPLVNYGYEDELLLPLTYTPPADALPGTTLQLRAKADWLVCKDVCIPESVQLTLKLPVLAAGATPGSGRDTPLFERTAAELPALLTGWNAELLHAGKEVLLTLERSADLATAGGDATAPPPVQLFPYLENTLVPAQHDVFRTDRGYAVRLALMDGASLPDRWSGIAVAQGEPARASAAWGGDRRSVEFHAPVRPVAAIVLPAGAQTMPGGDAGPGQPMQFGGSTSVGVWTAVALAFAGGMLLNLMPCVFPVLSIKLLGLARQGAERPALRRHALAYSGGVVFTFLALAGLLLALRAAGSAVGWGFQLQEPGVVFALALLFFLLGLNLMGGFEFSQWLPARLSSWKAERPAADAFAGGVLAVVAASPCTAPFMGAALGYAVTQSPAVSLAVFGALGLGMALPYAALVAAPGWRHRLPKPGVWMLHLKQGLAFPMFATVVWLVWVLGQQAGVNAAAAALLALVMVAFAVWLAGTMPPGVLRRALPLLLVAGTLVWSWPSPSSTDRQAQADGTAVWQAYAPAAVEQTVSQGQPVFVDFTAAWCVSCQVNKQLVLESSSTQAAFSRAGVALMRADWTHRDPVITDALAKLGRNGVPVYVLYRPGQEPLLLPEILTSRLVREALATLPAPAQRSVTLR